MGKGLGYGFDRKIALALGPEAAEDRNYLHPDVHKESTPGQRPNAADG
jgi:hypothetical protein